MPRFLSVSVLALCLFTVTFAVNLQAPLYGVYTAQSGYGATAVTLGFAAYVVGLMPSLVLLGGLSDRIGRRVPIALALLFGGLATWRLVVVPSWESLVVARFLLGAGTGFATTAGTAYMTELLGQDQAKRAALFVTSATSLGFGGGALATGASLGVQGATLIPASYVALFVMVPVLIVLALCLPRLDQPRVVSLLRLPVFVRGTWVYGAAMALAWSATGMTIAVVPLQLQALGFGGWTGLVVFLAIFVGFLSQPMARRMGNAQALGLGFILVPLGYAVLLLGLWQQALVWILIGTSITSAASYGFSYLASLAEVSMRAPQERARASAGLFAVAYAGFTVPVIGAGVLADQLDLLTAMLIFGFVHVLVTLAVCALWRKTSTARSYA